MNTVDISKGDRFGKLVVLSQAEPKNGKSRWHCRCDCGKEIDVRSYELVHESKSCGCHTRTPRLTPEETKRRRKTRATRERLRRKYGITPDQMKQMYISQNGCCAICHRKFEDSHDTCMDHNHITGKVRQLLCGPCNLSLGLLKENVATLHSMIGYINKWSQ